METICSLAGSMFPKPAVDERNDLDKYGKSLKPMS